MMSDPEKKICRYFNTIGGCWFGDSCKFLHIPDKRPPCKFFCDRSLDGCRFGESCHFSHDAVPLLSVDDNSKCGDISKEICKENLDSSNFSDTNNNNITRSTFKCLTICDPPATQLLEGATQNAVTCAQSDTDNPLEESSECCLEGSLELVTSEEDKELLNKLTDVPEFILSDSSSSGLQKNSSDAQIVCGSCKRSLKRKGDESYCNLLKDHYLECFLDKEGDHVKCVKAKATLELGQMYWCKACILIFEKPWSLFQHMADKAKGAKVQRWEKKLHLDWIDSVAGLMAGHDLGLFSPVKLRTDLRTLLTDQHTVEDEMEAAAVAAAAMVHWLAPISNPWRLHQREMMRKIENLHRQMLRKAGGAAVLARAALTNGPVAQNFALPFGFSQYGSGNRHCYRSSRFNGQYPQSSEFNDGEASSRLVIKELEVNKVEDVHVDTSVEEDHVTKEDFKDRDPIKNFIKNQESLSSMEAEDALVEEPADNKRKNHLAGASGDHLSDSQLQVCENQPTSKSSVNKNRRSSSINGRYDADGANIAIYPRGDSAAAHLRSQSFHYSGSKYRGDLSRGFDERPRSFRNGIFFGGRQRNYGLGCRKFESHNGRNVPSVYSSNKLSFSQAVRSISSNFDMNCGFTDEEVEELLCQGIKPWDSEASAALAVLHGEMDHLLN